MKPVQYYKGREQTYLKHLFLERYLETVAYHIGYSHREFVYVVVSPDRGAQRTRNSATRRYGLLLSASTRFATGLLN